MKPEINRQGVLKVEALTMRKALFAQIEHRPRATQGSGAIWPLDWDPFTRLIGYVRHPSLNDVEFVGVEDDKMYRIREHFAFEYLMFGQGGPRLTREGAETALQDHIAGLEQIFLQ